MISWFLLLVISGAHSLATRAFPCALRRRGVARLSATRGRTSYLLFVFPVLRDVLFPKKGSETLALRVDRKIGSTSD